MMTLLYTDGILCVLLFTPVKEKPRRSRHNSPRPGPRGGPLDQGDSTESQAPTQGASPCLRGSPASLQQRDDGRRGEDAPPRPDLAAAPLLRSMGVKCREFAAGGAGVRRLAYAAPLIALFLGLFEEPL